MNGTSPGGPVDVLHVLGTAQPEGTAQARVAASIARTVCAERYRTHLWFLGPDGRLAEELAGTPGVADVLVLGWRGAADPAGTLRAWRALRARRFAVVHQHMGGPFTRWVLRAATRAKLVAHLHSAVSERPGPTPAWALGRGADAVVATSAYVAARAAREASVQAEVLYPCVPAQPPARTGHDDARGLVVGTAARLVLLKGVDVLLRAFAALVRAGLDVRLEIAGAGHEEPRLRRLAGSLGLGERVSFLGWRADLAPHLARWDVFALPSREEAFGLAALEAMDAGLPVVVSNTGGLPELVDHGRTGLLVPPGDDRALAAALGALATDAALQRRLGRAARERAATTFSCQRLARQVSALYERLLTPARGQRAARSVRPPERR